MLVRWALLPIMLHLFISCNSFLYHVLPMYSYISVWSVWPGNATVTYTTLHLGRTGPRSAVGNVSGYRCEADCRTRVASSIPARSHIFVETDHEIISTVILLPSAESFMKGCCQLQAKVCARLLVNSACSCLPRKKVWLGELTVLQSP